MGFYIQGPMHGKAQYICEKHGGTIISHPQSLEGIEEDMAIICVIDKGIFEAAGFCFNEREFEEFNNLTDPRPRTWVKMDKAKAKELSRFPNEPNN